MRRLLPSSLLGQVMVSVALALLIAQAISVSLLLRAGEERRENAAVTTAAFRLINGAQRATRESGEAGRIGQGRIREQRRRLREAGGPIAEQVSRDRLPRALRYTVAQQAPAFASNQDLGEALREVLEAEGILPHAISVSIVRAGDDPVLQRFAQTRPRIAAGRLWRERDLILAAIQRTPDSEWETARLFSPSAPRGGLGIVLFQTLVTFVFLIAALFFVIRRITRPLAMLTTRVDDFSRNPDTVVELAETGPSDTRRLIAAHNAMEARIAAMLDEKDVMLGAIGHDLKTPLAALRVRIESVGDEDQRLKMAASIEDITETLDDILSLARMGRKSSLHTEAVDMSALAIGVVEEFEDLGEPVTLTQPPMIASQRVVAQAQVTWIKRALRNLISNAVRYAGACEVSIMRGETHAILRVEDNGPGIPDENIAAMMEPFTRGEASRNRATGGAGLGLTLARAIAKAHGGELVLANRAEGGLRAEIRLPLGE